MTYTVSPAMALAGASFTNMSNYSDPTQDEGGGDGAGGGAALDPYAGAIPFVIGMLAVFSVIGTIGNALVLYIFTKMLKQKLTSTVFILTLAGTDFVTCLITIPTTIAMEYYGYRFSYDIPCKIYHALITTTVPYSSVIMVGIAIDRYLCICHPFLRAMNIQRARWMVIGLAVMTFSLGITISLFYGVYSYVTTEANVTIALQPGNMSSTYGGPDNISSLLSFYYNESDDVYTVFRENFTELRNVTQITFTGICDISNIIFSDKTFFRSLQYIHASIFAITVFVVSFLYILIFQRILANTAKMRKKRRQVSSGGWSCADCCSRKNRAKAEETQLAPMNGDVKGGGAEQNGTDVASPQRPLTQRRNSKKSDKALMANLKIAGTLFVVCLVFFVAFLPAWLMALKFINFKIRLFYCYFVYNIANPVIYAFMNQTFRQQLNELFCRGKRGKPGRGAK